MRSIKKTIGYFIVTAICYMYIVTMTSSFNINIDVLGIATHRAQLLIAIVLIGIFCMLYGRIIKYNNILKSGVLLMLYMFFCGINQNDNWASWLSCSIMWFFIILIIYNMDFSEKNIIMMTPILWGTSIILSIVYIYGKLSIHTNISVASTNSIYFVLCALPFAFLMPKIRWQFVGLFVSTATILISGKGTCLLALGVIWILFAIRSLRLKNTSILKIVMQLGVATFLVIVFAKIFQNQTNLQIIDILENTWVELTSGGNGRSDIYASALNEFADSNIWNQFFGHGYNWINRAINIGTHNDFLMVLCNYGLIGLLLYLTFWLSLIHARFQLKKTGSNLILAYDASVIVFFAVSMGSNVLNTQIQFLLLCVLWGICSPHLCRNNSSGGNQYEDCACNSKY